MQAGRVEKRYLAVVRGRVRDEAGTVDAPIDRDPQSPHIRIVTASGYPSVTHYETVERFGEAATLVSIRLETGRTHQIRVHMKHIGHPLLGDSLYGAEGGEAEAGCARSDGGAVAAADEAAAIGRQALHAAVLAFAHPADGRPVRFEAPLPADMIRLIERLRNDSFR
jgi:23S rRNA pseudouridine1911/1915/1917 synthase